MSAEGTQYVEYSEDGVVTIATVCGSDMLDGQVVDDFGHQVLKYVGTRQNLNLLLDFESVNYLSSAALTELIKINDAVVGGGGSVRICGLVPQIQKVFEITNFDKSFEIHSGEHVGRAVARFKRSLELAKESDAWDDS